MHSLPEPKFILQEKFILLEALDRTEILKNLSSAKTNIASYFKKLTDTVRTNIETAKVDADEAYKLFTNFIPAVTAITKVEHIRNKLKTTLDNKVITKFVENAYADAQLKAAFDTLRELGDDSTPIEDAAYKNDVITAAKAVKALLETSKRTIVKTLSDTSELESFKTIVENTLSTLAKIEKVVETLDPLPDTLEAFAAQLVQLIKYTAEEIVVKNEPQAAIEKFTEFHDLAKELLASIADVEDLEDNSTDTPKLETDWDREYRAAVDKDSFWASYVRREWGDHATEINAILKAIKLECTNYGFTEELNPFISYIKNYYLPYDMSPQVYFAIHDAVARQYLKLTDLLEPKNEYRDQDIIFCQDLTKKSGKDALDYLSLQKDLAAAVSSIDSASSELTGFKRIVGEDALQKKDLKTIHHAVMYDIGDLNNPDTPKLTAVTPGITKSQKLRPHQEIQLWIKRLSGKITAGTKEKKAITDVQIKSFVEAIKSKADAVTAVIALALFYTDTATAILNRYTETASASTTLSTGAVLKVQNTLKRLGVVDNKKAVKIIEAIAKAHDFTLRGA